MSKLRQILIRLISLHQYPRYIVDSYLDFILTKIWRSRGILLGKGIKWSGIPIIAICKGSTICIGDNCRIISRSKQTALGINHSVVIRTLFDDAILDIGSNVRMSGTTICAARKIKIGNRCVIGSNVIIVDTDFHSLDPVIRSSPEDHNNSNIKPVIIGDDVFIGGGTYILKGVSIGVGSVVGAGSVVTSDIPPNSIAAGNPARIIKSLK